MKTLTIKSTNNEMQNQLTKLNNKNFYWASVMGNSHIFDSETDEWIICIDDNRIYFNECGKLSNYKYLPEFDIIFESREIAKIVCATIINSEF